MICLVAGSKARGDPLLVGLAPDEAPEFIGLQAQHFEAPAGGYWSHAEVIRQSVVELGDEATEPRQAHATDAADAA